MPFNSWNPWDVLLGSGPIFSKDLSYPTTFIHIDAFYQKFLIDEVKEKTAVDIVYGDDIELGWVEEKLGGLSLFSFGDLGGGKPLLVLESEKLKPEVIDYITNFARENQSLEAWSSSSLVFFFDQEVLKKTFQKSKNGKAIKELMDEFEKFSSIHQIKEPKFWENRKTFDLFAKKFSLVFNPEAQNYFMEAIENSSFALFDNLSRFKGLYPENKIIQLGQVKAFINDKKIDQFVLAKTFSLKNLDEFFKMVLDSSLEPDSIRALSSFMQGHLLKIMDTSYLKNKTRPSKYDEEILVYSSLWNKNQLQEWISFFSDMEILAKQKSDFLKEKFREAYLASLNL